MPEVGVIEQSIMGTAKHPGDVGHPQVLLIAMCILDLQEERCFQTTTLSPRRGD